MATPATKAARRTKFAGVFSKIRDELIDHFAGEGMPQEAVEWYRNVRACFSVHYSLV
jgi:farnesyl diphosphate synthase